MNQKYLITAAPTEALTIGGPLDPLNSTRLFQKSLPYALLALIIYEFEVVNCRRIEGAL